MYEVHVCIGISPKAVLIDGREAMVMVRFSLLNKVIEESNMSSG
jgi:hypothetical protein